MNYQNIQQFIQFKQNQCMECQQVHIFCQTCLNNNLNLTCTTNRFNQCQVCNVLRSIITQNHSQECCYISIDYVNQLLYEKEQKQIILQQSNNQDLDVKTQIQQSSNNLIQNADGEYQFSGQKSYLQDSDQISGYHDSLEINLEQDEFQQQNYIEEQKSLHGDNSFQHNQLLKQKQCEQQDQEQPNNEAESNFTLDEIQQNNNEESNFLSSMSDLFNEQQTQINQESFKINEEEFEDKLQNIGYESMCIEKANKMEHEVIIDLSILAIHDC